MFREGYEFQFYWMMRILLWFSQRPETAEHSQQGQRAAKLNFPEKLITLQVDHFVHSLSPTSSQFSLRFWAFVFHCLSSLIKTVIFACDWQKWSAVWLPGLVVIVFAAFYEFSRKTRQTVSAMLGLESENVLRVYSLSLVLCFRHGSKYKYIPHT
jgi:hypothetical protein